MHKVCLKIENFVHVTCASDESEEALEQTA